MRNARRPMTRSLPRRAAIAAVAAAAVIASAALPHAFADARGRRPAELDVTRIVELTELVRQATDLADGAALPPAADRAVHTCPLPRTEPCPETAASLAEHAERVLDSVAAWLNFVERLRAFFETAADV